MRKKKQECEKMKDNTGSRRTPQISGSDWRGHAFYLCKSEGGDFRAFLEGKLLRNEVDFVTGYRKRVC